MKPRDLKARYESFEDRRPTLEEGVLCVPRHYAEHKKWPLPAFSSKEIFNRDAPIELEFCSGNGEWIIRLAMDNPDRDFIAVERQFKRVRKIWSKMRNEGVKNLLIVCGNAEDFAEHYVPPESISKIYINFPDPWPKGRHAKHRLLQVPFAHQMSKIIRKDGELCVVTDDLPYCEQAVSVLRESLVFDPIYPEPFYETSFSDYGSSYFRRLWEGEGREIKFMKYTKGTLDAVK